MPVEKEEGSVDIFQRAKPIWLKNAAKEDEHAEFSASFHAKAGEAATLYIAADSNYAVFINGKLVGFGQ